MGKLSDIAVHIRRQMKTRKDSLLSKKRDLEAVFEFDRQLSSLSRRRDRAFAMLALEFINVERCDIVNEDFQEIVAEIKRVEAERGRADPNETSTLTELIVPDVDSAHSGEISSVSFMTHDERQSLYRGRLRGLYIDLGELILRHPKRSEFTSQVDAIEEIQEQMLTAQNDRQEALEHLASTTQVSSLSIVLGIVVIAAFVTVSVWY
ncbi:MAG: hypothetical protein ACPGQS_03350 [Bradymonadia bacterium]